MKQALSRKRTIKNRTTKTKYFKSILGGRHHRQFINRDYRCFKKTSKKSLLTVIENYYDTNTYQKKYLTNPIERHARISEMLMQIDLNEITPSLNYPEPESIKHNKLKIEEFNKLLLHFHKLFKSQNNQCDTNKFGMMHI